MAIAFDNASGPFTDGTPSLIFPILVSGSNRFLEVVATANSGFTTTSVTFNGAPLTLIAAVNDSAGPEHSAWYMVAPDVGTFDVEITASGSVTAGGAASYTGVDQTTPINASTTGAEQTTATLSAAITTTVDNSWIVATARAGSGQSLTGVGSVQVRTQPEVTFFGGGSIWDSGTVITPAGASSADVTCTSQFFGPYIAIALSPAASGGIGFSTSNLVVSSM